MLLKRFWLTGPRSFGGEKAWPSAVTPVQAYKQAGTLRVTIHTTIFVSALNILEVYARLYCYSIDILLLFFRDVAEISGLVDVFPATGSLEGRGLSL
jgi:hypothetical protein